MGESEALRPTAASLFLKRTLVVLFLMGFYRENSCQNDPSFHVLHRSRAQITTFHLTSALCYTELYAPRITEGSPLVRYRIKQHLTTIPKHAWGTPGVRIQTTVLSAEKGEA